MKNAVEAEGIFETNFRIPDKERNRVGKAERAQSSEKREGHGRVILMGWIVGSREMHVVCK